MISIRRSSVERSPPLASGWCCFTSALYFALTTSRVASGPSPITCSALRSALNIFRVSGFGSPPMPEPGPGRQRPRPLSSLNMLNGSAAPSRSASGLPLPFLELVLAPIFLVVGTTLGRAVRPLVFAVRPFAHGGCIARLRLLLRRQLVGLDANGVEEFG